MPDGKFLISFRFHFENRYKELERDRKAEAIYTARLALIRPCINKNGQLAWPAAWKPNRQPASLFYLIRRMSSILFWLFFHFFLWSAQIGDDLTPRHHHLIFLQQTVQSARRLGGNADWYACYLLPPGQSFIHTEGRLPSFCWFAIHSILFLQPVPVIRHYQARRADGGYQTFGHVLFKQIN